MARVNRRRARAAAAAAVGALALAGCGIHPGQAAVVGGTDISPEQVDETAAVVCLVDQTVGGVQAVARSKAVEFLVGAELIQRFGASEGALPTPGQLSQSPALEQIQNDARSLPAAVQLRQRGAGRQAECLGHLVGAEPLEVAQHQREAHHQHAVGAS